MNQLTGMLSRIGIITVVIYFAFFAGGLQVLAMERPVLVSVAEATAVSVGYSLPYPGVLPDNPFYFLKVARDQVLLWLITDPGQKSFYTLFLADKRLVAGQVLVDSGKTSVGVTTLVKGEDYFSYAVDLAVSAKGSGRDVSDLTAKLVVAGAKHNEILGKMVSLVSAKESFSLAKARQNNADANKRIMELLLESGK